MFAGRIIHSTQTLIRRNSIITQHEMQTVNNTRLISLFAPHLFILPHLMHMWKKHAFVLNNVCNCQVVSKNAMILCGIINFFFLRHVIYMYSLFVFPVVLGMCAL